MEKEYENGSVDDICLKVFGALTASVTHEIKNTLSIINENAGLLEDLCAMAEGEAGIPAEHVGAASKTVMKQVDRSNTILKNLNRFAHSGDKVPAQANMEDTLTLMAALTGLFAAMKKITVTTSCQSGVEIQTNLLVLESLLVLTLSRIYDACPEDSVLMLRGEVDDMRRLRVRFMLEGETALACAPPGLREHTLAAEIGVLYAEEKGEVLIDLTACAK